jgi:hypothetical protein
LLGEWLEADIAALTHMVCLPVKKSFSGRFRMPFDGLAVDLHHSFAECKNLQAVHHKSLYWTGVVQAKRPVTRSEIFGLFGSIHLGLSVKNF